MGGQVLDRGFTVEGLTVTYMPRGPGVGNADTIQQRARFFGYKRPYIGYCRVFLDPSVADLYRKYVRHEEDVRQRLVDHITSGRPFSSFRRAFCLDRAFRPTRQSVIDVDYTRPRFPSGWCVPSRPHDANVIANRSVVESFLSAHRYSFHPDEGHPDRQGHQKHLVGRGLSLSLVYEELLTGLQIREIEDSQRWTAALMLIDGYIAENPDSRCTVYQMRPGQRTRRQVRNDRIVNLFQGAYPVTTRHVYPGDRELHDPPVTIQIHVLALHAGPQAHSAVVSDDLRFATIWMSPQVRQDVLTQPQGGN